MRPEQVRRIVRNLDLAPEQIGVSLDTGRSSIYRWMESGTDGCNAILLRLLASGKITIQDVEQAHD